MHIGADMRTEEVRQEKNKKMLNSPWFAKACELADTPVTRRQASKFNNGYGKAYSKRHEAMKEGDDKAL